MVCVLDSFTAKASEYGITSPTLGSTSAGININPESTNQFDYGIYQPGNGDYFIKDILCIIMIIR